MMRILSFTYMHPDMVFRASQLLQLGPEALEKLSDRYVLTSIVHNEFRHDCAIHEIMYQDFENHVFDTDLLRLKELEKVYPPEMIEQVFPKTDDNIRRKLSNTISFAMDKVYKCDKLLVTFAEKIKHFPERQGVPNAIYRVVHEDFETINETVIGLDYHIIIKKRS